MAKFGLVYYFVLVILLAGCESRKIKTETDPVCGQPEEIGIYELNRGNLRFKFTNYGATMLSGVLPDKNGNLSDVVLGFQTIDDYKTDDTYFGAIVGRVANRIGRAHFHVGGKYYQLANNDGKNILHGGYRGFSDVVWKVDSHQNDSHITFSYHSYDGEEGFPGEVHVYVTYLLINENELGVKMEAIPLTKPTPVNLALHTYWNLAGHNSGDILSHKLQLFASHITPVDDELIPTGEIKNIKGTAYDFLEPREIGSRFDELSEGYDINYVLDDKESEHLKKVAVVEESKSGRKMEVWSNQVGVQFYSSNMLDDVKGKDGAVYRKYAGIALETQGFPDAVNHPNFPSQVLNPGDKYENVMVFRFTSD